MTDVEYGRNVTQERQPSVLPVSVGIVLVSFVIYLVNHTTSGTVVPSSLMTAIPVGFQPEDLWLIPRLPRCSRFEFYSR